MKKLKVYILDFDTKAMRLIANVAEISNDNPDIQYDGLCNLLGADGFDVIDYNDDLAIVVEDKGFYRSYNPVFELELGYGGTVKVAGRILFLKNQYNEFSVDLTSITYEDIFYLRRSLDIKLVGMVK